MGLLDKFSDLAERFAPSKISKSLGGIGSGHGMVPLEDDMIVSKPAIVLHVLQIVFNFLAMCCFASVASFQAKWHVGPSGLSGFALFISIVGILISAVMLLIPAAYEKYDKFVRLARAFREVRVGFILTGTGVTFSLLVAFIVTISAWTQPGCKDANKDPSAEANGDAFKKALPGWCGTKKAGAVFFWLAFVFWLGSLALLIIDWRSGKLVPHHHREQLFDPPARSQDEETEEDAYEHVPPVRRNTGPGAAGGYNSSSNTYPEQSSSRYGGSSQTPSGYTPAAGRSSMDPYGAFSDPTPSGFGTSGAYNNYPSSGSPARAPTAPPTLPEPEFGQPMLSRTMQYADPYAAVRATIQAPTTPPSYESYQGYR